MKLTGAEILWECLIREGVDLVFGYPGGAILPAYDAMTKYPQIHHVLVRHEQGAAHMADGYARATGKVGVAVATSGPGATNLVTGIATAMLDSSPIVCITGQVPTSVIGSDAFQEIDITGITLPITKHNYLVTEVDEIAPTIREAFHIAKSGRPGPVLVDIPKDVQIAVTEYEPISEPAVVPSERLVTVATTDEVDRALALLEESERPLILAGHGLTLSGAEQELLEFAEKRQIPVALTLLGKGTLAEGHPLCLGMMGMHGEAHVNIAIQEADLLLAFGMRFDDRVTGDLKTYAQNSKKIHVDIDASEINKNVRVDLGIVGDLKHVIGQITERMQPAEHAEWVNLIQSWQDDRHLRDIYNADPGGKLYAAHVIRDLWKYTGGECVVVTDVGQHQMWEAQYYHHQRPRTLITSGGLGTMGFAVPASIGAKMGLKDGEVWTIVGDGGFQMTMMELATAVEQKVNVNIAIMNNSYLGMVRQWQEFFYEERYHATPMGSPDFCKLADAYRIPNMRVTRREEIPQAVEFARQQTEGPVLIEFVVEKHDIVYPMVPAGASLHNMIRRPVAGAVTEKE
ncbi:MAG: biosynthetic-type acetolactate synthase large subunit [Acidobacteriota bacterium]|nr:MAG: biosynthetic-type acetolactate synthase large subunit [Acidobacteriota bacterium]